MCINDQALLEYMRKSTAYYNSVCMHYKHFTIMEGNLPLYEERESEVFSVSVWVVDYRQMHGSKKYVYHTTSGLK